MIFHFKRNNRGFTIVELLVVIVVIGILAAVAVVSYTGVSAKANAASAKSDASLVLKAADIFSAVSSNSQYPISFGALYSSSADPYSISPSGFTFNTQSGNKSLTTYKPALSILPVDTVDYRVCGVGTSAASTNYATMTVLTGIQVGYWDYAQATPVEVWQSRGTVSGTHNTYTINCYNVGIGEAVLAVARAMYQETGNYPATAAALNANTANGAKMPYGVVAALVNPTSATTGVNNGKQYVKFECTTAVASTLPCLTGAAGGVRITVWDYQTGTATSFSGVPAQTLTLGATTAYAVPAS